MRSGISPNLFIQGENWDQLWQDILELCDPENPSHAHFLGSLVFGPSTTALKGQNQFLVIDGQQRLITLSLVFCALRYIAHKNGFEKLRDEIQDRYLIHPYNDGDSKLRIYPRQRDRDQYIEAITKQTADIDGRIGEVVKYFVARIEELGKSETERDLRDLFDLLQSGLEFVYIQLEGENPYRIFKSLNSTGVDLSEADLIRNFVFMHVDLDDQDKFDDKLWRPIEAHFQTEGELDSGRITRFFRDFLMQGGRYVALNGIFDAFESRYLNTAFDPEALAQELQHNANIYDIISGKSPHPSAQVDKGLQKLLELDSSTTYPLLLNLMHRRKEDLIDDQVLHKALELLAGFIMRRFICGESSRTYGRWFVNACAALGDHPLGDLVEFLTDKGFPPTPRFVESFTRFNLYGSRYARSVLVALERTHGHKEPADLSDATIEHIMPRSLSQDWYDDLGPEADQVKEEWSDTIGNLTLSAYNSELHNYRFSVKREEYAKSNITLNRQLAKSSEWGEEQIQERGGNLAKIASEIWMDPGAILG